jgi:hypothetical protein
MGFPDWETQKLQKLVAIFSEVLLTLQSIMLTIRIICLNIKTHWILRM